MTRIADEIHSQVCEGGFDPDFDSFVKAYGSKRLDASLLLIALVGSLPATDPWIRGTLRAIKERLLIDGEFVLRYESENPGDGLPAGEGAFLACRFWLVDNYILQGRHAEARKLFERLLARCNDVGLLAEELDPLKQAEIMLRVGLNDAAGRTAYLAGYHAAQALIFENIGKPLKTHAGVQTEFLKLTKDDPRVDSELRSFLSRAYSLKAVADYDTEPAPRFPRAGSSGGASRQSVCGACGGDRRLGATGSWL